MKICLFEFEEKNYTIKIGKNKSENLKLIDDSNLTDIWFHVEDEPSCHVILTNNEKLRNIPRQVLKRCAYLCKINSKAKKSKETKIIYTQLEKVIKVEEVVIVDRYKWLMV
jgi:predicted ribosome quality control (RQC) complex YloA/Tae2 family protein|uniref:NFACT RNA-binding domain-containing protein n=1 Tax=viral metagenome TaxID=1070528 RepID=A0A6C0KMY9_9ZZZZ